MKKILSFSIFLFSFLFFLPKAYAHEAYVLTQKEFQQGLLINTPNPLASLLSSDYIQVCIIITLIIVALYGITLLWSTTSWAGQLDALLRKAKAIGPLIIRIAISSSFFYAALGNAILGPELSLSTIQYGEYIRLLLFALSLMVFFGFLTEIAAAIGLGIFFFISSIFGWYMVTYANYFGELVVLFLFGSRLLSIDRYLFGTKAWNIYLEKFRSLEIPIVRILYGIALIFAGWTIKFAHQSLSVAVYNQYHLINFFHAPAQFIAAGAGVSEILIGVLIVLGFMQRLTVSISLIFITLSLLYFREMLWPHLMLYGISFSLIINSADRFTIDRYIVPYVRNLLWRKKT